MGTGLIKLSTGIKLSWHHFPQPSWRHSHESYGNHVLFAYFTLRYRPSSSCLLSKKKGALVSKYSWAFPFSLTPITNTRSYCTTILCRFFFPLSALLFYWDSIKSPHFQTFTHSRVTQASAVGPAYLPPAFRTQFICHFFREIFPVHPKLLPLSHPIQVL